VGDAERPLQGGRKADDWAEYGWKVCSHALGQLDAYASRTFSDNVGPGPPVFGLIASNNHQSWRLDAVGRTSAMKKKTSVAASKVVKKLPPGVPGTLKHVRKWGEALVCVRHRHDSEGKTRYTTVELVVEQAPIQMHTKRHVTVRLDPHDIQTRSMVLAAGGRWNPTTRLWRVPRDVAQALDLHPVGSKRLP
jgi:hypothetical protein